MRTENRSGSRHGLPSARAALVGLALAVALVGGALALTRDRERGAYGERAVVTAPASTRWPAESLEDWVTFADQISTMTVVAERQLPLDERTVRIGEGLVGREVTAVIRSTLWAYHPQRVIRGTTRFRTWGWWLHDGELVPVIPEDEVRLEVGDEIVAPLMRTPEGDWAPVVPHAVLHLDDGRIELGEGQARALPRLRDLHRRTVDELAARLQMVRVDPRLRELAPDARAEAVRARR